MAKDHVCEGSCSHSDVADINDTDLASMNDIDVTCIHLLLLNKA